MPVTPSLLGSAAAAAAAAVRSGAAAASAGHAPRDDRPRPPRASGRSRGAEWRGLDERNAGELRPDSEAGLEDTAAVRSAAAAATAAISRIILLSSRVVPNRSCNPEISLAEEIIVLQLSELR